MSAIEAVGSLPGGGEFVELWQQVDGDPGAVDGLGALFRTGAADLDHVNTSIDSSVGSVHDGWSGAAANSFTGYMHHVTAASDEVHQSLVTAGTQMQLAGQAITEARDRMNAIAGQILDRYNSEPPVLRDLYAHDYVEQGCAEARTVVDILSSHLSMMASQVTTAAEVDGFAPLHAAGARGYLPAKGRPIRWTALPKDDKHPGDHGTSTTSATPVSTNGTDNGGTGNGASTNSAPVDSSGPKGPMPTGDVKQWIAQASKILEAHGVPAGQLNAADINMMIQHESSGNPHAENDWDSNAAAGHPSKGLMQTIDSTFDAYSLPGHKDIWNPVDNIIAGVRYAMSRYGSLDNVPGVKAVHNGGSYVGY